MRDAEAAMVDHECDHAWWCSLYSVGGIGRHLVVLQAGLQGCWQVIVDHIRLTVESCMFGNTSDGTVVVGAIIVCRPTRLGSEMAMQHAQPVADMHLVYARHTLKHVQWKANRA